MASLLLFAPLGPLSDALQPTGVLLDPKIRDWVLIPIFVVMVMQGVVRSYLSIALSDDSSAKHADLDKVRVANKVRRSQVLRANGQFIPVDAFRMRKTYLVRDVFEPEISQNSGPETPSLPMSDPMAATGMMKQMLGMYIPQMLLMPWVTYFFSGFVLVKLPFGGLSDRFKVMLQRGITLKSLDPSYVSSLSWYFIIMFGLRGLFSIILRPGSTVDEAAMMQKQMQMTSNPMQQQDSAAKLYGKENTELKIQSHSWVVPRAEARLLQSLEQ